MDKMLQMKNLVQEILMHNKNYYDLDSPTISDKEYDILYDRLVDLEEETGIVLPNSPTQRVGGEALDKFVKRKHFSKLYSMGKVRSFDDVDTFVEDIKKVFPNPTFAIEHKFDGLSIVCEYKEGKLLFATTRGNGEVGEDVTAQVKTIRSVPLEIDFDGHLIVQGEGMMKFSSFERYNKTAEEKLKNPRNAVAGAIRNLDPKETAKRNLDVFFYAVLHSEGKTFKTQKESNDFLKSQNFLTDDFFVVAKTSQEIKDCIKEVEERKNKLDFLTDGVVIKLNEVAPRAEVGYTNKFPKWARAFKFEAEETSTMLQDVIWQVDRTGKVSPTAILQPVELAGATISRATLNNIEDIRKKQVMLGARVFIRRSNEVIPEVLGLAEKFDTSIEIEEPIICPSCGSSLVKKGPLVFCENKKTCKEQIVGKLTHFVSRDALNIEGLSEKTIIALYENLGVRDFSDLYKLSKEDLLSLEGFKEKKAENIIKAIEKSKQINLANFVYAIGIGEVGIKTAKDCVASLAPLFQNFENAKNDLSVMTKVLSDLEAVEGVGEVIAENFKNYFSNIENMQEISKLLSLGIDTKFEDKRKSNTLAGFKIVLTGSLEKYSRNEMTDMIESHGGAVSSSVSKNTSLVVAGEDAGSKLEKAKTLGVKVLSEKEFLTQFLSDLS